MREVNDNLIDPVSRNVVHLIRLKYWDGGAEQEIRLCDAVDDLDIDVNPPSTVETWTGSGVLLSISSVSESGDLDEPGVDITLDGVDTAIISIILGNDFRGRQVEIWRVWLEHLTGKQATTPQAKPLLIFDGFQNAPYKFSETFTDDVSSVSVSTRVVGSVSAIGYNRSIASNPTSHNEMLERAGLSTGDTFFQNVAALENKEIYWGRDKPGDKGSYWEKILSDALEEERRKLGIPFGP